MTTIEKELLWTLVQQAMVLRRVESARVLLHGITGDLVQHEARYQRTIKDVGLVEEAKAIEERLTGK